MHCVLSADVADGAHNLHCWTDSVPSDVSCLCRTGLLQWTRDPSSPIRLNIGSERPNSGGVRR